MHFQLARYKIIQKQKDDYLIYDQHMVMGQILQIKSALK